MSTNPDLDAMYAEWLAEEEAAWEQQHWEEQLERAYLEYQDREYALWLAEQPEPETDPYGLPEPEPEEF